MKINLRKPGKAKDGQSPAASEYSNAVSKIFFLYQISNRYIKVKKRNIYKNIILDYINKWTPFINQYQITNFEAHGNGCYVKGLTHLQTSDIKILTILSTGALCIITLHYSSLY